MDYLALGFYACICGLLSVFAPQLGTPLIRMTVGAVVGITAALLLPVLRGMIVGP